jgi:signal transduction histidine kinase/ABC-type nitrate/sulfonate/bicarbonate transport system substrate-binding protein
MKKILHLFFISIVFFSTVFAQEKLQKVSLSLEWLDQFQFAGYYMAKEKGFYKDVGLDVEIQKYDAKRTSLAKVLNSEATYGIGGASTIRSIAHGANVIMLGAILQSTPMILISREESHIKSTKDLIGKRIMFSENMLRETKNMLFGENFPLNQVHIQEHSHNIEDLINKKTDVMSAYISNEPFLLNKRGIKYNIISPKNYGVDFYSEILFTSRDELENHKQRAIDFRDASLKGWRYAFRHIEESVEVILKKYNTQHKSKAALIFEAKELKKLAYYRTDKLGVMNISKIKKIYNIYRKNGVLSEHINISDYMLQEDNLIFFTKKEKAYLAKHKVIKYVYDPDWRPFEWKNGLNEHMGIIADILKIVSKRSGLEFKAINTSTWQESTQLMKQHKADMYSAVPKTKEREENFKFTNSDIYNYTAVFISNVDNKELILNDISYNIKGKIVGIIKGNSLGEYIKHQYVKTEFIEFDSVKDGFDAIRDKKIDFFVINAVTANYYINNKGYVDTKIYANADYMFRLKIALQKDISDELLSILDKTLNTITDDEKEAIFIKWITMKVNNVTDWDFVLKILIISFIVFFILLYIVYIEKKHTKELDIKIANAIKELKRQNKNLLDANNSFKELLNSTMEMIIISDEKYNVIEANKITLRTFNLECTDIQYVNLLDAVDEKDIPRVKHALSQDVIKPYELDIKIPNVGFITVLAAGRNIIRDGKKIRISTILDITELKQAQHQLVQQSRLAQMGEMLSMIAHQWRQPLSAISATSGSISLKARRDRLDKDTAMELANSITKYAQHLSSTIDDFRNFFKDKKDKDTISLKEVVEATLHIVNMSLENANIKINLDLVSDKEIQTYANELKQVILNIIKNAQDVLVDKEIQNPQIDIYADNTTIVIRDNAGGIPKEIIDKIFDPYFSTKTKKDGTGLGLYMSKIIIEEHCGGKISVYNGDNGAVFKIELFD